MQRHCRSPYKTSVRSTVLTVVSLVIYIAPTCPEKEKEEETDEGEKIKAKVFISWEDDWQDDTAGTYVTYQVGNASESYGFQDYDVLLDNQADVSIVHARLRTA
jgi:hypothetical protein